MPPQQQYPPYGQQPPPQPQYPQPNPNPSQQGLGVEYDFIFNSQSPKKPGIFNKPKMLLVILGLLTVLALFGVGIMSIMSKGKTDSAPFVSVVQQQTEIVRISALGYTDATNQSLKNFLLTTELGMTADKSELVSLLKKGGIGISEEEMALRKSTATDTTFANAKATSAFDETVRDKMQDELQEYQDLLRTAHNATDKKASKDLFNKLYNNADLLLKQSESQ